MASSVMALNEINHQPQVVKSTEWSWEDDENAEACRKCRSEFTFLNRRHHCRSCGKIFCGLCLAS